MAGDRYHLRAAREQQVHDLTPYVSRRSGNEDHSKLLSCGEVTLRCLNVNSTLSLFCSHADRESLRCCSLASPCVLQGNEQLSPSPSGEVMQGPRRMLFQGSLAALCPRM